MTPNNSSLCFMHPFRIDAPTLGHIAKTPGQNQLHTVQECPDNIRFLNVDPVAFSHASFLLAKHPQQFPNDLSLYLSTVRTFFDRNCFGRHLNIPQSANTDARKRLSEDLGVAISAYFMVEVFGLGWETISQIPHNQKLSKKRPDFQGYSSTGDRFLFEAKGTTALKSVEGFLSKAIDQVKNYPEPARSKLAIVTFICIDDRFFPSTSFVVDPPALPESVPYDLKTSRLLHFEKLLHFAGCHKTAAAYIRALSFKLRDDLRALDQSVHGPPQSPESGRACVAAERALQDELKGRESRTLPDYEFNFIVNRLKDPATNIEIELGVEKCTLENGIKFSTSEIGIKPVTRVTDREVLSIFSDGTYFLARFPELLSDHKQELRHV